MSVVRTVEEIGPCRKELVIEVPAPAVDAETERVVREYGRRAKIPGFRPGKVPPKVVRQRFRQEIDQEVVDRLVPRYWRQAEAEKELRPLTQPELAGVEEREDGGPLVFTAHVEVRPEIELGNIEDFDLPDLSAEPTDEEVDKTVEELRQRAGDWVPVERAAAQGDLVSIGIREVTADQAKEEGKPEKQPEDEELQAIDVEVGSPNVWEELSLALTGRTEGQKGDFSRMDENDGEVRERSFQFEVHGVKERELPELDDELAEQLGGFESVDALRTAVRERLGAEKASARSEQREKALLDQLRERNPLALPAGVVEIEVQGMVREYAEGLARQGVDLEHAEIDWRAMGEQARPAAEKRVHARLLLDAVADKLGIEVTEEELERALSQIARGQKASTGAVRRALDQDGRLTELQGQMRRSKTVRRLLGEEPEATEAEAVESAEAGETEGEGEAAADEPGADPAAGADEGADEETDG